MEKTVIMKKGPQNFSSVAGYFFPKLVGVPKHTSPSMTWYGYAVIAKTYQLKNNSVKLNTYSNCYLAIQAEEWRLCDSA